MKPIAFSKFAAGLWLAVSLTQPILAQKAQPEPLPSGSVPPACVPLYNTNAFVDCWLGEHPQIAGAIVYWFEGMEAPTAWPQWPDRSKQAVRDAYRHTRNWYLNKMTGYEGALAPDPPTSLNDQLMLSGSPAYLVSPSREAWILYTGHVGLALAVEIHEWVPWSIRHASATVLHNLFNAYSAPTRGVAHFVNMFRPTDTQPNYVGAKGYISTSGTAPANAIKAFKFLKDNDLIGATQQETIGRLLAWSSRLKHSFCGLNGDRQVTYGYWQSYFGTTVSGMIEGTVYSGPAYCAPPFTNYQHYTQGCSSTVVFWEWVLRTVNIPVVREGVSVGPGQVHAGAWFPSINMFVSHGDSPYDSFAAGYPGESLLLSEYTYNQWFPPGDFAVALQNADRRVTELGLHHPGPGMLGTYCLDQLAGRTGAASNVYQRFAPFYTLSQVNKSGLWSKLAEMAVYPGCPTASPAP